MAKSAVAPKLKSVGIKKKKDEVKPVKVKSTVVTKKPVVKAQKASLKISTTPTPSTSENSTSPV